jgi:hypothetical protein
VALAQTSVGVVIVAEGGVQSTPTDFVPEAVQPATEVTVTPRETVPVAPAVKVIAAVPCPVVIVPFVIVQE